MIHPLEQKESLKCNNNKKFKVDDKPAVGSQKS